MKDLMMLAVLIAVGSLCFAQSSVKVNYEDGALKSEYVQRGELVAVSHYYPSGKMKETGFFKNEIPDGKWETFAKNGEKTAELNYRNGQRHGEFRLWDEFAHTYTEIHYAHGKMIQGNKWVKGERFAATTH